eukprot:814870-Pelagomonas_calceolata.AAC.5
MRNKRPSLPLHLRRTLPINPCAKSHACTTFLATTFKRRPNGTIMIGAHTSSEMRLAQCPGIPFSGSDQPAHSVPVPVQFCAPK